MQALRTIEPAHKRLLEQFLLRLSPATAAVYRDGLKAFARWLGTSPVQAVAYLTSCGSLEAATITLEFQKSLQEAGRAPQTVHARLKALRSLVRLAQLGRVCDYELDVVYPTVSHYRNTAGPGTEVVQALLQAARAQAEEKAARDVAMLRLLYDLGLRRGEVASLRLVDLNLQASRIAILGKGQEDRTDLTLPPGTRQALQAWLEWRGDAEGPLFHRLDPGRTEDPSPLTGRAIWHVVLTLSVKAGVKRVWPHGIRHSAITAALDAGYDIRVVQRFSRHKSIATVVIYDDNRKDLAGQVATAMAAGLQ